MYSRLIEFPENKSFFLFGPRGTGKTTLVKKIFSNGIYIDLLEASLYNDLLANPQRLESFVPKNFKDWIVIDEVQRIPDLLNEIHRLIEQYKYKFVLTHIASVGINERMPPPYNHGVAVCLDSITV